MNREVIWRAKRAENTVLAQHTMDTQKNSVKLQRWPLLLVPYLPFVYEIHIFGSKWHLTFTTQMYNSLWAFHAVHTWLQMHHMFKTMYICNTAGMASHRTMVSEPSTYHDLLHPLHWALHVTQAQTSYINASMHVFATQNHGNSFAATWRRLRIKCNIKCHIECHTTTQIIARICIHAHQLRRGWGCESIVDGWSLWVFMRPCTLHSPFHSLFRSPYISQCIVHDKSADNYALMSTP